MTTKTKNKSQVLALTQQLIAGTAKHLTGTTQVQLVGSSFTSADITAKLQSIVTLQSDVDAAKAATKAKLATQTASMPRVADDVRPTSAEVDHAARVRSLDAAGAAGRGQRGYAGVFDRARPRSGERSVRGRAVSTGALRGYFCVADIEYTIVHGRASYCPPAPVS
jgi:hypothetical protein